MPEQLIHRKVLLPQVTGVLVVALRHRRGRCCGDVGGGRGALLKQESSSSVIPELVRLERQRRKSSVRVRAALFSTSSRPVEAEGALHIHMLFVFGAGYGRGALGCFGFLTLCCIFFFFFLTLSLSSFWTSRGHGCRPFSLPVLAFNFHRA